ncbi:MAG: glycosyltransferase family 39 protein [Micropruina sp.]
MTTTTMDSPAAAATAGTPDRPVSTGLSPLVKHGSLALTLLAVTVLYTWNLAASGYANSFYSAAVQAGAESWTAFFYGSLDAGNSITVDKTPASLWLMALSVRLFGLSSWSILLPQALLGVASAWILYGTVRRSLARGGSPRRAHWAGIVAALAFALTPAATLMFRFNNPDALMVFCYVAAAALTLRAAETASRRHLAAAGALIGLGFLAKMLQAFVLLPSLALAYAIAAPASWRKKVVDLLTAFGAMVLAFGWWVAIVELVPESWRPYIGGSQTNSILELTFGYNGLDRSGSTTRPARSAVVWLERDRHPACSPPSRGPDGVLADPGGAAAGGGRDDPAGPSGVGRSHRCGRASRRTAPGPWVPWCCSAAGWWSTPWCSATWPASTTTLHGRPGPGDRRRAGDRRRVLDPRATTAGRSGLALAAVATAAWGVALASVAAACT